MLIPILALFQPGTLNPLFAFDASQVKSAYETGYEKGSSDRKMSVNAYIRPLCKDMARIRNGKQGWTAPYAAIMTPVASAALAGFGDGRNYVDKAATLKRIDGEAASAGNPAERSLNVLVALYAWPGLSDGDGSVIRDAKQSDVTDVTFVVLVDGTTPLRPNQAPKTVGEDAGTGAVTVTREHTEGYTDIDGNYSTVRYTTESQDGYSYFSASYQLSFPLYAPNGSPYITPNTKSITLKVIRQNGEHSVTFAPADIAKALQKMNLPVS